jgi:hypothetical protein
MQTHTETRGGGVSASTRHFVRHYVEMVVAMFLGMGVLLPPLGAALRAVGTSLHNSDVLMISVMADMTAAMAIPTLTVLVLLWTGLVGGLGTLLLIEHVAMLPSMLVAMLLRRDEYTGAIQHRAHRQVAA